MQGPVARVFNIRFTPKRLAILSFWLLFIFSQAGYSQSCEDVWPQLLAAEGSPFASERENLSKGFLAKIGAKADSLDGAFYLEKIHEGSLWVDHLILRKSSLKKINEPISADEISLLASLEAAASLDQTHISFEFIKDPRFLEMEASLFFLKSGVDLLDLANVYTEGQWEQGDFIKPDAGFVDGLKRRSRFWESSPSLIISFVPLGLGSINRMFHHHIYPLGLVDSFIHADGTRYSRSGFFIHDQEHAIASEEVYRIHQKMGGLPMSASLDAPKDLALRDGEVDLVAKPDASLDGNFSFTLSKEDLNLPVFFRHFNYEKILTKLDGTDKRLAFDVFYFLFFHEIEFSGAKNIDLLLNPIGGPLRPQNNADIVNVLAKAFSDDFEFLWEVQNHDGDLLLKAVRLKHTRAIARLVHYQDLKPYLPPSLLNEVMDRFPIKERKAALKRAAVQFLEKGALIFFQEYTDALKKTHVF